jgi:hypothetical protein
MLGDEASESELRERLTEIVCATPPLMQVLSVARHLRLPDWLGTPGTLRASITLKGASGLYRSR